MKLPIIPIAKKTSLVNKTGLWSYLKPEMTGDAPCGKFCPAGENIRGWINLFKSRDFAGAYLEILKFNPFPELMPICPHPCQDHCNMAQRYNYILSENEKPVAINELETSIGKMFLDCRVTMPPLRFSEKIAVVGGGPAGLCAAFYLRWAGYEVTIFEKSSALGGMLRECVPKDRLPREFLRGSLKKINQAGINFCLNSEIVSKDLESLIKRNFAVFLAAGAQKSRKIFCEGNLAPKIIAGLSFLKEINEGFGFLWLKKLKGAKVIVVGGGDTSIDVALEAKRLGAKEVILSAVKITAHQREVKLAEGQGVKFFHNAYLRSWTDDLNGKFKDWAVFSELPEKFDFRQLDELGRESKNFIFTENVDFVFAAIGETSDLSWIGEELAKKIMVIGNAGTGPSLLARALADAREAVLKFHKERHSESAFGPLELEKKDQKSFMMDQEFYENYLPAEANRCLNCGVCIDCRQCLLFCPDSSVIASRDQPPRYAINYDYCKGCGICAERCRAHGSFCIKMVEEVK